MPTRRTTFLLASALLLGPACAKAEPPEAADADQPDAPPPEPRPPSTLALGEPFAAFDIVNSESGERYCQVCRYGPKPKIMAVGTLDDEAFVGDLRALEALLARHEGAVAGFAVIAEAEEGLLVTPVERHEQLLAEAEALRTRLGLSFPVVLPAPGDQGQRNGIFESHYALSHSRTIMCTDARNRVVYSEVAPAKLEELDQSIRRVLR